MANAEPDPLETIEFSMTHTVPPLSPSRQERVVLTSDVCGGHARIRGTRVSVWGLEDARRHGISDSVLLEMYPTLTSDDLAAAWKYVAEHTAAISELIASNSGE